MLILGLDPGASGGACLLQYGEHAPHKAPGAWAWAPRTRQKQRRFEVVDEDGYGVIFESIHAVAAHIAEDAMTRGLTPYHLVLEGLFAPKRRKGMSPQSHAGRLSRAMTLAESAGELLGPLRAGSIGAVIRPQNTTWRARVLRLPGGYDAKAAEAYAVKAVPQIASGLGVLASNGHAAEAACLAYFGGVMMSREGSK